VGRQRGMCESHSSQRAAAEFSKRIVDDQYRISITLGRGSEGRHAGEVE